MCSVFGVKVFVHAGRGHGDELAVEGTRMESSKRSAAAAVKEVAIELVETRAERTVIEEGEREPTRTIKQARINPLSG